MKPERKRSKKPAMVREETAGYGGPVVLYRAPDGKVSLDIKIEKETVWLSLNQMVDLFDRDKSVVSRHLRNIFQSGELDRNSVVAFFATTAVDGKTYQVEYFNLDAVISVGYRVNSKRGTQFRIWATHVLRDHILKGYSVNERRLKELRQSVQLVGQVLDRYDVSSDQAKARTKESRNAAAKAKEIEDAVFDLKAVNPHKRPVIDTRTPEDLLDLIEAKGREISEALAVLRRS